MQSGLMQRQFEPWILSLTDSAILRPLAMIFIGWCSPGLAELTGI
jgi:hypothetical protein